MEMGGEIFKNLQWGPPTIRYQRVCKTAVVNWEGATEIPETRAQCPF